MIVITCPSDAHRARSRDVEAPHRPTFCVRTPAWGHHHESGKDLPANAGRRAFFMFLKAPSPESIEERGECEERWRAAVLGKAQHGGSLWRKRVGVEQRSEPIRPPSQRPCNTHSRPTGTNATRPILTRGEPRFAGGAIGTLQTERTAKRLLTSDLSNGNKRTARPNPVVCKAGRDSCLTFVTGAVAQHAATSVAVRSIRSLKPQPLPSC